MWHGTTLSGLMPHHGTDPHAFLDFVHDNSLERISPDPELNADIRALPGRRLIFTNGDAAYASRVLERLDLVDAFEFIHDIHACQYVPKPDPSGYRELCERSAIAPCASLFSEDMARNLTPAKPIGLTTVWVNNGSEARNGDADSDVIHKENPDLAPFMAA